MVLGASPSKLVLFVSVLTEGVCIAHQVHLGEKRIEELNVLVVGAKLNESRFVTEGQFD